MRLRALAGALACCGLALCGCGGGEDPAAAGDGGLGVVTTSYPLQYLAEQVGGERARVENLIAPGADAHDADVSPRQLAQVVDADVVVHLSGLQPAVDDVLGTRPPEHLVDAAAVADLDRDPHFWLDPLRMAQVGRDVAAELGEVDPDGAAAYEESAERLAADLQALDGEFEQALAGCAGATLVTSHEAFAYLAERHDLRQVGIAGIDPGVEPSPARVRDVLGVVREGGVSTIFFEATANPAVAELLAEELGVATAVLHPIERVAEDQTYPQLMRENLAALRAGLPCARPAG
ncbi:zinc ABC transporter solute-binding protein [Kineococcus sp. T13]|uniref:metal ABC transporter solute-binding protein, Zn/Mn family n=1 Tax=Kineococcus vitellinus TaxID=2696565 RepID=UPI00141251DB|nr:zinc ABC transporter solute-binding protein [Kineococcus vitellinus]